MKIAVIGSGISAVIVAKTFLKYNYKVHLIDSEDILDKENVNSEKQNKFIPNIKKSPKYNNKNFIKSLKKFKKKYNIKTKKFFLASGLISGGLSNFWGAGIEIPNLDYLKKYSFGRSILKEHKNIDRELKIDKNKFNFFDFFFKQKTVKTMLKKKINQYIFLNFYQQ